MLRSRPAFRALFLATLFAFLSACGSSIEDPAALVEDAVDSVPEEDPLALMDEETTTTEAAAADTAAPTETTAAPAADTTAAPAADTTAAPADTAAPVTTPAAEPVAPAPDGGELERAEAESFRLLNELRAGLGLAPLTRNPEMDAFARDWSTTMAGSNFEHSTGPYGENIAWASNVNLTPEQAAAQFHDQWVNSAGHYANMTNSGYTLAGMGLYKDPAGGWFGTHVFE